MHNNRVLSIYEVIHAGMIQTLEDADNTFDLIYSVDVFGHIRPEEMPFEQAREKIKTKFVGKNAQPPPVDYLARRLV
ncbi:MAG: class I SAM-dependent methyltransferase [Saprospiraceae bacterium]